MNSFAQTTVTLVDPRRDHDVAPELGAGRDLNAAVPTCEPLQPKAGTAARDAGRGVRRIAAEPYASTSSRRCAGSRARTPTCRASATRAAGRRADPLRARRRADLRAGGDHGARAKRDRAATAGAAGRSDSSGRTAPCRFTSPSTHSSASFTPLTRPSRASSTSCCTGSACSSIAPGRVRSRPSASTGKPNRRSIRQSAPGSARRATVARRETRSATFRSCSSPAGCRGRSAMPTVWRRGCTCSSAWWPRRAVQRALDAAGLRRAVAPDEARPAPRRPRRRARRPVWDVQHKFRIVMGPLRWERFARLAAGRRRARAASRAGAAIRRLGVRLGPPAHARRDDVPRW